jgi:hypothetical protein
MVPWFQTGTQSTLAVGRRNLKPGEDLRPTAMADTLSASADSSIVAGDDIMHPKAFLVKRRGQPMEEHRPEKVLDQVHAYPEFAAGLRLPSIGDPRGSNSTRIWALQATRSETLTDSNNGSTRSSPGLPQ